MSTLDETLRRALEAPRNISAPSLAKLLADPDTGIDGPLFAAAAEVKRLVGKTAVLPRGLIECSNVCAKDCLYCGIRKSNAKVPRYRLSEEDALAGVAEARRRGYPAVAFQAGEVEGEANTRYYERLLAGCRGLEVTLSLGEQTEDVYRRWRDAGAMRYLIRVETSNRELYGRLHPAACSFDRRVACIRALKRLGYVTGTGVMIGLPGQTADDLARDIVFFGDMDADMVGMGPYIPHPDTPLATRHPLTPSPPQPLNFSTSHLLNFSTSQLLNFSTSQLLNLSLRMIALTRLYLHDVNIVAATALEALDPARGRERGIAAGANVVMPNVTPPAARAKYDLYPGKAEA